jgi:hypothetical protein
VAGVLLDVHVTQSQAGSEDSDAAEAKQCQFRDESARKTSYSRWSEGCPVFISELFVHHTIPTQPVTFRFPGDLWEVVFDHRYLITYILHMKRVRFLKTKDLSEDSDE